MPYNIIKNQDSKYELRLVKNNQLLGTHKTKKDALQQIKAIEINKTGRLDQDLWEISKEIALKKFDNKHSARMIQYAGKIYRELGGEYTKDLKPNQESLKKWTLEDWGRDIEQGRYLPKYVREKLTPEEYLETSIVKMKGNTQYVKQPKKIIEKIRKIKEEQPLYKKIKIGNKTYTYYLSDKPNKKLMTIVNGKKIYFGATGYEHYRDKTKLLNPNLQHFDDKRRKRYIMRASNIKDKEDNYTAFNPESPNFHALNILW